MVRIPRSSVQQRVGTGDMRCGGGCEEQREPSDIRGCTKAAGGLVAREGFFAGGFQAKGSHFRREQAGQTSIGLFSWFRLKGGSLPWEDSVDSEIIKKNDVRMRERMKKSWFTYVTFEELNFSASCDVRWFTDKTEIQSSIVNRLGMELTCRFAWLV